MKFDICEYFCAMPTSVIVSMGESSRGIKSIGKASKMLRFIQDRNGATLSEIAEYCGLSPGTVHSYLVSLEENDFLAKANGEYVLDLYLISLGEYVRNQSSIYLAAKEEVENLSLNTKQTVHLMVYQDERLYTIYQLFGENASGKEYYTDQREDPDVMKRLFHCTACGKAILAQLDSPTLREILESSRLTRNTPYTITDVNALEDELKKIRERGYALNNQERIQAIRAVGAPIVDESSDIVGAVSVSGPTNALQGERFHDELPRKVMEASDIAEINLQTVSPMKD